MAAAMTAVDVVHLKRRVRSPETNLFEWRKCECSVTGDGLLVLELINEEATADIGHGNEEDDAEERGEEVEADNATNDARVEIDLAWQLQSIEQKKKCKTRCEMQYVVLSANAMRRNVKETRSEELMAPSPRHCQQWIELVQEAEKRAKRRQSIRQGTATAVAVAAMSASSSTVSSATSASVKPSVRTTAQAPRGVDTSFNASASSASAASSSIQPPSSVSSVNVAAAPRSFQPRTSIVQRNSVATTSNFDYHDHDDDESEPLSPGSSHHATAPLPRELFAQKLTAVRQLLPRPREPSNTAFESTFDIDDSVEQAEREAQHHHDYEDADVDEELEAHHSQQCSRLLASRRRVSVRSPSSVVSSYHGVRVSTSSACDRPRRVLSPSSVSSTTVSPSSQRRVRPSSATLLHSSRRHQFPMPSSRRGLSSTRHHASAGVNSAAAVAARIQRLRRREGRRDHAQSDDDDDDDRGRETDGNTREELSILMRVETALRQLERENALAKERELELAHEVQSLQDALRVRSAEKKHLESQLSHMSRDKEQWKQAAQRAEQALTQMQDELVIAQEESQLLSSEKHRLKHHNKELLAQVHRLDSIVYGRF